MKYRCCAILLETSKPRKGTEMMTYHKCIILYSCVRNIKAPEGDGNLLDFIFSQKFVFVRNIKAPEGDGNLNVVVLPSFSLKIR